MACLVRSPPEPNGTTKAPSSPFLAQSVLPTLFLPLSGLELLNPPPSSRPLSLHKARDSADPLRTAPVSHRVPGDEAALPKSQVHFCS